MPEATIDSPRSNEASVRARRRRAARYGWGFLAPFALLFTLSFLVPIVISIYASFFQEKAEGGLFGGGGKVSVFVGLENYKAVVTDERFWRGIGRVMTFGAFQIPVMILGALALALLLDSLAAKYVSFYRLVYFLPFAIPGVIAAMVWSFLYHPEVSPLVKLLAHLGIEVNFFDKNIVLASMANMTTWTFMGYNMLIFLAALQSIPHDLYEAARIDGATGWTIVRKIKIPMVKSAALLAVLLSIIGTIQLFNEPQVITATNPGLGNMDYTPMMMAYNAATNTAYTPNGLGPGSAISIVMAIIAGVLAAIYAFVQSKIGDKD
ncbi:MAG: sugar ABC transporter permease [Buchananella hordeovulneris]|nr:sugar ABC transporter permease [Buchananella hordeovulneris]